MTEQEAIARLRSSTEWGVHPWAQAAGSHAPHLRGGVPGGCGQGGE